MLRAAPLNGFLNGGPQTINCGGGGGGGGVGGVRGITAVLLILSHHEFRNKLMNFDSKSYLGSSSCLKCPINKVK